MIQKRNIVKIDSHESTGYFLLILSKHKAKRLADLIFKWNQFIPLNSTIMGARQNYPRTNKH